MPVTIDELKGIMAEQMKTLGFDPEKNKVMLNELLEKKFEELNTNLESKFKPAPAPEDAVDHKGGFFNVGDLALNVFKAGRDGRNASEKLIKWDKTVKGLYAEHKAAGTGLSEGNDEYGGYLVPTEYRNDLWKSAVEKAPIFEKCRKIPMGTNSVRIPSVSGYDHSSGLIHGGIQFVWLDELTQLSDKRPKFEMIELRLKKAAALAHISDEIMQDSPITLTALLPEMFSDGMSFELTNVLINGTGGAKPMGLLNAPCTVSVAKETGQAADTIVYENIVKMYARQINKGNAVWIANHDCVPQLYAMGLSVGTGGVPVFMPANGVADKPYATLFGRPIIFTEHAKTIGDTGDIYFADLNSMLVGQKAGAAGGLQVATSIHLKFDYDQQSFRFLFKIDAQPAYSAALTPRYSSDTLSPIVKLDER